MIRSIFRLERIVFGDPSDIINNLLDDKSGTKAEDKSVDSDTTVENDEKDSEDSEDNNEAESNQSISVLNCSDDTRSKEKKAAWVDEDDYHYT